MRTHLLALLLASTASTTLHADLSIVELGGEKTLKWTAVQTPKVSIPLTLENSDKTAIKNIVVDVTPFHGSGRSAAVLINGAPPPFKVNQIATNSAQTFTLTADLPIAATYRTFLTVRQTGKPPVRAIVEVERVRAPAPIEIASIAAKVVPIVWNAESAAFVSTLVSTGEPATLAAPQLQSVTFSEKASGGTSEGAASVGMSAGSSIEVGTDPVRVPLELTGIARAGRYDAVVRFTGPGYAGKDLTLTVYAREHFGFALACIALGVAVSVLLRAYSSVIRPRLLNERRVATLFAELDELATGAPNDAEAVSLVQSVRRALTDHWNGVVASGSFTAGNALDVFDKKLLLIAGWIELRGRVAALSTAALRKPFEDQLSTARGVLLSRVADAAAVDAQRAILDTMPAEIDRAVKAGLQQQLTELQQQLANDLRPELDPIRNGLAGVGQLLADNRLREAGSELDALQRRYIGVLIDDLSARVLGARPVGVADREWADTHAQITGALAQARQASTASAASDAFRGALRLFLNTLVTGLASEVAFKIANKSKFTAEYTALKGELNEIQRLIRADDLLAAWKGVEKAHATYKDLVVRGGGTLGAAEDASDAMSSAPQAGPEFDVTALWTGGTSAADLARGDAMQIAHSKLERSQLAISLLIFVIAVLIGFKTLWVDNLTWGGWASYLAAFLWGVGFDQLGHVGLMALIRKG